MKKDNYLRQIIGATMEHSSKTALISINFETKQQANQIACCLEPEIKKEGANVKITVSQRNEKLFLEFNAKQTPVLRAAINSYIRWIETANSVYNQFD